MKILENYICEQTEEITVAFPIITDFWFGNIDFGDKIFIRNHKTHIDQIVKQFKSVEKFKSFIKKVSGKHYGDKNASHKNYVRKVTKAIESSGCRVLKKMNVYHPMDDLFPKMADFIKELKIYGIGYDLLFVVGSKNNISKIDKEYAKFFERGIPKELVSEKSLDKSWGMLPTYEVKDFVKELEYRMNKYNKDVIYRGVEWEIDDDVLVIDNLGYNSKTKKIDIKVPISVLKEYSKKWGDGVKIDYKVGNKPYQLFFYISLK